MAKVFNPSRMFVNASTSKNYSCPQWMLEYLEQVANILNVCFRDALMIVESNAKYRTPMVTLIEQCKMIKELDIPPFSVIDTLRILKLRTYDVEHRYCLLQDLGVKNITLHDVGILNAIMQLPSTQFKAHFKMRYDENLVQNLFNSIGEYPKNMPSLEKDQHLMPVEDIYNHYLVCYKRWKVGMFWTKRNVYYNRPKKTNQLLSFRLIKETERMLRTEFDVQGTIPKQMYPFFITTPTNVRFLLSKLPEFDFGGKNVKDIMKSNPRILLSDPHNVYSVCKVLKEHNVPVEPAVERYRNSEIFILDCRLVAQRLREFSEDPFLQLWCQHRSMVNMILHHAAVWRNIYILRATSCIQNCSFATITLSHSQLYRFFKRNCPVYPGKYVKYFLNQQLDLNDNRTLHYLQRHTRWYLLTAMHTNEILQFLKTLFPKEAIRDNIHIIMYSRSDVSDALQRVKDICNVESCTYSQQLALCVYLLEIEKCPIMDSRPRLVQYVKRSHAVKSKAKVNRQIDNMLNTIIFSGNAKVHS